VDYLAAIATSSAGLALERTRLETAARNLAHASAVQDPASPAFQPQRVVVQPAPAFAGLLEAARPEVRIEATGAPWRRVHEPGHPLADAQGMVSYPAVDTATEMVTLMASVRSYEANLAALAAARTLALKTLEIGRQA
jgi:flagellar basal-body rod protein FlgC